MRHWGDEAVIGELESYGGGVALTVSCDTCTALLAQHGAVQVRRIETSDGEAQNRINNLGKSTPSKNIQKSAGNLEEELSRFENF